MPVALTLKHVSVIIAGFGAVGWGVFFMFELASDRGWPAPLVGMLGLLPSVATVYLIVSQKLYALSASETIEEQNRVLTLQIEQKRLKKELEKS
jgi:hypothetical protein